MHQELIGRHANDDDRQNIALGHSISDGHGRDSVRPNRAIYRFQCQPQAEDRAILDSIPAVHDLGRQGARWHDPQKLHQEAELPLPGGILKRRQRPLDQASALERSVSIMRCIQIAAICAALLYPVSAQACLHYVPYQQKLAAVEAEMAKLTIRLKPDEMARVRELVARAKSGVDWDALEQAMKMLGVKVEPPSQGGGGLRC